MSALVVKRPAVILEGGPRDGWCYYTDAWDTQTAADEAMGRPPTYKPAGRTRLHPSANAPVECAVMTYTPNGAQ